MSSALNWTSNICEIHEISKMIVNEKEVCPRCECEKMNSEFEEKVNAEIHSSLQFRKQNILQNKSLLQDKTLLKASFKGYIVKTQEELTNKQLALNYLDKYKKGQIFNLWFYGKPGVGKSHLSMSILKELNGLDISCLFIDIDEMLRKIRNSFQAKESPFTEQYFIDLLSDVDFLVLDDLGAETGNIDTDKQASDFTSRVLRAVINARQDKATIITTNLSSGKLLNMYDPKLISRMMKNLQSIIFKETTDKRLKNIGF